jgi:DNA-binding transcriptional LysR family regulator
MELRELAAFREVARQASFGRAAARLGFVQSTVSAQIRALEDDLGVRLFDRLGRTISLTGAGAALLPFAEQMLDLAERARAEAVGAVADDREMTGTVAVSAPESLLTYRLPALLSRFRAEHPGVTIDLRPTPIGRFRGESRRAIATGAADLAFVLDARVKQRGFASEVLIRESISVIAPVGHALADVRTVAPSAVDGQQLLLPEAPEAGCEYRGQFERHLADSGVSLEGALEFASIETVKQCVIAGMGIAVLPRVAVESEVLAGRLAQLPWREPFEVYTQVVWSERRSLSPAHRAFIAAAREVFGRGRSAFPDGR